MSGSPAAERSAADPERVAEAVARRCDGAPVTLHETHISWVFLAGERAYKLKKPIVLDFLDYGTVARRRALCHEEVRLNARLAAELYLGVSAVAERADRLEISDESDLAAVDYVVEMRRYDEKATLAARVDAGLVSAGQMAPVGEMLARFHAECPPRLEANGLAAVRHEVRQNLSELADACALPVMLARVTALGRFLDAWITAHAGLLEARGRDGCVREVHGDLRAEHVIMSPRLSVVDCVEFDPALRTLDVADDLAFLVMDLTAHGVEPCAAALVAAYRRFGGDCGPDELLWFYAVHRALIRAKVALMRAAQGGMQATDHGLVAVAERCAWRARRAPALVVCGVPGSGKSHVASALHTMTGAPVVSSDVVRKELAGLAADERAPEAAYGAEPNERTYRELGRRAAEVMAVGAGVIVDATFRHRADREAFAGGWQNASGMVYVQCLAPADVLRHRGAARELDPRRISDAGAGVVERERDRFDPLDETSAGRHLLLRTDRDVAEIVGDLLALLDRRLGDEAVSDPARSP